MAAVFKKVTFISGIFMGTVVSCLNFFFLSLKVKAIANRDKLNIISILGNFLFRYLLMAGILWLATKISIEAFFGSAVGLFMIRGGIYILALQEKGQEKSAVAGN